MILEHWAPKIIGYVDNPNHKKIDIKLIKVCNNLQKKIKKGGDHWISNKTYNTKKNEISDYLTANQISKLLKLINSYCQSTGFPTVNISNAWINIQGKNTILKKHAHPLSVISGALFLKADQDSSGLYFSNPLKHHYQPIEHTTPYSFEYYKINAIQGTLVIFPSWLEHSSNELINNSNKRIVLSFNTNKI